MPRSPLRRLASGLEAPFFDRVHARYIARAEDQSEALAARSCLVLAPHPDDEVLCAGGTIIRRLRSGARVVVIFVTTGSGSHDSERLSPDQLGAIRQQEGAEACRRLGVDGADITFLGIRDGAADEHIDEIVRRVGEFLAGFAPDDVIAPAAIDAHPDHLAVNVAARRLIAEGVGARLLEAPIWHFTHKAWRHADGGAGLIGRLRAAWRDSGRRPVIMSRLEGVAEQKRLALNAHESQVRNITGEPGWATLPQSFVRRFFTVGELFFPVEIGEEPGDA